MRNLHQELQSMQTTSNTPNAQVIHKGHCPYCGCEQPSYGGHYCHAISDCPAKIPHHDVDRFELHYKPEAQA